MWTAAGRNEVVWNVYTSPGVRSGEVPGRVGSPDAGLATWNENVPLRAPVMLKCVWTVTVSPARNARPGTNEPPKPSESARIEPPCERLRDPMTVIPVS